MGACKLNRIIASELAPPHQKGHDRNIG